MNTAQNHSGVRISQPTVNLPKGGGAVTGMGESFQASAFTGFAELSINAEVTPCRDFEPELSIDYSTGNGNGPFGLGFELSLPSITRRTDLGVPCYDETDRFVLLSLLADNI